LTKNRILQELSILNSIKLGANALIGFSGITIVLMMTTILPESFEIINQRGASVYNDITLFLWLIPLVTSLVGLGMLVMAIFLAITHILPHSRNILADPEKINNKFSIKGDARFAIKNALIQDLKTLVENNKENQKELREAYIYFGVAIVLILLPFFFGSEGHLVQLSK